MFVSHANGASQTCRPHHRHHEADAAATTSPAPRGRRLVHLTQLPHPFSQCYGRPLVDRAAGHALRSSTAKARVRVRRGITFLILFLACLFLYGDLFSCDLDWKARGEPCAPAVVFRAMTFMAGLLFCESAGLLVNGALIYGCVYARQRAFWMGVLTAACMFGALLSNWNGDRRRLLYAVPICAALRLIGSPMIERERESFSNLYTQLSTKRLDLDRVLQAVDAAPALHERERRKLQEIALSVNVRGGSTAPLQAWEESDLRLFLREAEMELAGRWFALPMSTVDACLARVLELMAGPGEGNSMIHYGIFATLASGVSHLAHSGLAKLVMFCGASLLDGLVGPLQAWLISLITSAIVEGDESAAAHAIGAFLGSYLLQMAAYCTLLHSYAGLLARGTAHVQCRVATQMLAMNSSDHSQFPEGVVSATFASDITRLQDLWTGLTWSLLSPLSRVLMAVIYALHASPPVGILALSVFPLIFMTVPQSASSGVAAANSIANAETIAMFQNGVHCQRMLWSCDKQTHWLRHKLFPLVREQMALHTSMRLWGGVVQAYVQQLVSLFVAMHVAVLAWLAVTRRISVAEFTGFVSLLSSLGTPSISLGGFYRVAVTCAGSARRIDEFLGSCGGAGLPPEDTGEVLDGASGRGSFDFLERQLSPMAAGELVLQDVSYRYPGSQDVALSKLSVRVAAGTFAAVVGGSGCGKTTLLSMITTWLRPSQGCVSLGDRITIQAGSRDIEVEARRLRKSISVVYQDTMLLNGTVAENIAISAKGRVSHEDIRWAAEAAGCAEFIESKLPDGYDTMLGGAEGVSLSGGQAQRICIARALCRKPTVLLLDEATSALDPKTEEQIVQTIAGLRRRYPEEFRQLIVLCITHHVDILQYCDQIIYMSSGSITHEENTLPKRGDSQQFDSEFEVRSH